GAVESTSLASTVSAYAFLGKLGLTLKSNATLAVCSGNRGTFVATLKDSPDGSRKVRRTCTSCTLGGNLRCLLFLTERVASTVSPMAATSGSGVPRDARD